MRNYGYDVDVVTFVNSFIETNMDEFKENNIKDPLDKLQYRIQKANQILTGIKISPPRENDRNNSGSKFAFELKLAVGANIFPTG